MFSFKWKKPFLVLTMLLLLLTSVDSVFAASTTTIANNGVYACRRTFGGGLYDSTANKTFVCWSGAGMDVYVNEYNHSTNAWGTPVKIADWDKPTANAYHDYPTMVLLPDGKLGIFLNSHAVGAYLLKAPNTHSIAGTWAKSQISTDKNCYPMPVVSGSDVYYFYSRNDDLSFPYRTYKYIKSSDSGSSWSSPLTVIDSQKLNNQFDEVYAYSVYPKEGKIYITWVLSGGPLGHNGQSKNLYIAYFNTSDGKMYTVAGGSLGNMVDYNDLSKCVIEEASPTSSTKFPITYSAASMCTDGTVVVAYGKSTDSSSAIKFARWDGASWTINTIASGTSNFKDITKAGDNAFEVLYMSGNNIISTKTADKGSTWTNNYTVAAPYANGADNVTGISFVEGRHSSKAVSVFGTTFNYANRDVDYSGKWPVFSIGE